MGTQNGLDLPPGIHDQTLANLHVLGTWTGPIVKNEDGDATSHPNLVFIRCLLEPTNGAQVRWGFRLFNLENGQFINVTVNGVWWEHPFYLNVIGALLLFRCKAFDAGAQGLQVVWRNEETNDVQSWQVVGDHFVNQCNFTKVGLERGDGRRSYVLSFFGKQIQQQGGNPGPRSRWDCPVVIQDTVIDNRAEWVDMLRGAVMAEHRPSLSILGGSISHDGPADRPLVHSYKNDLVLLDGTYFKGSKTIDIIDPLQVDITNCTGNVPVRLILNGHKTDIGPVNQDFHWTA